MEAPLRSAEEVCANAAFDALLKATAWPGSVHALPDPGVELVIAALIDRECVVYASDPIIVASLMRTGARLADPESADYVFCSAEEAGRFAAQIRPGSDYYPDDGATLVVTARLGSGASCRLSGPGIETSAMLECEGLDAAFWRQRNTRIRYPMGFDIIIVGGRDVAAIPRSTQVEIL